MSRLLKIFLLGFVVTFLMAGRAIAYPIIDVEGFVNTEIASSTDNLDGTTTFKGVKYFFNVVDATEGAVMNALQLDFEMDVFKSIDAISITPLDWEVIEATSADYVHEIGIAGTEIGAGDTLIFNVDFTIFTAALTDESLWSEGQIWGQSWSAADTSKSFVTDGGSTSPVPEPATMILFGMGLLGLAGVSRKTSKA